jgi:hypothetical protein
MEQITLTWEGFKDWLSAEASLTHHELHLILGVLLMIVFGRLLRRPIGSWLPLLPVLALELVNEALDFTRYCLAGWPWTPTGTLVDIVITMALPVAVVLAGRYPPSTEHVQIDD